MFLLTVQLGLIETVVFSCALVLLIGTIYFVSNTIKGLRFIKEEQKRKARHMIGTYNEDALIQKSSRLLIGNLFKGHSKRSKVTRRPGPQGWRNNRFCYRFNHAAQTATG
jgi:hypothetical protein